MNSQLRFVMHSDDKRELAAQVAAPPGGQSIGKALA